MEMTIKRPDRDFIPLRELKRVTSIDPEDCNELLCVQLYIEDEASMVTGVLVHAQGSNCPPGCYRITDSKTFRFVSSWTVVREDEELFRGQAEETYDKGVKDLRELAVPDRESKLMKDNKFKAAETFTGPGIFRGIAEMKDFLQANLKHVPDYHQTQAGPSGSGEPAMLSVEATATLSSTTTMMDTEDDPLGDASTHGMMFGFGRAAQKLAAKDAAAAATKASAAAAAAAKASTRGLRRHPSASTSMPQPFAAAPAAAEPPRPMVVDELGRTMTTAVKRKAASDANDAKEGLSSTLENTAKVCPKRVGDTLQGAADLLHKLVSDAVKQVKSATAEGVKTKLGNIKTAKGAASISSGIFTSAEDAMTATAELVGNLGFASTCAKKSGGKAKVKKVNAGARNKIPADVCVAYQAIITLESLDVCLGHTVYISMVENHLECFVDAGQFDYIAYLLQDPARRTFCKPDGMPPHLNLTDLAERGVEEHTLYDLKVSQIEDMLCEAIKRGWDDADFLSMLDALSRVSAHLHENTLSQIEVCQALVRASSGEPDKTVLTKALQTCRVRTDGAFLQLRYHDNGSKLRARAGQLVGAEISSGLAITKLQKVAQAVTQLDVSPLSADALPAWQEQWRLWKEVTTSTKANTTFHTNNASVLSQVEERFEAMQVSAVAESCAKVEAAFLNNLPAAILESDAGWQSVRMAINFVMGTEIATLTAVMGGAASFDTAKRNLNKYLQLIDAFQAHMGDLNNAEAILTATTGLKRALAIDIKTIALGEKLSCFVALHNEGTIMQTRKSLLLDASTSFAASQVNVLFAAEQDFVFTESYDDQASRFHELLGGADLAKEYAIFRQHGLAVNQVSESWLMLGNNKNECVASLMSALSAANLYYKFPAASHLLATCLAVVRDAYTVVSAPRFDIIIAESQQKVEVAFAQCRALLDKPLQALQELKRSLDAFQKALGAGHALEELAVPPAEFNKAIALAESNADLVPISKLSFEDMECWFGRLVDLESRARLKIFDCIIAAMTHVIDDIENRNTKAAEFHAANAAPGAEDVMTWINTDNEGCTFKLKNLSFAVQLCRRLHTHIRTNHAGSTLLPAGISASWSKILDDALVTAPWIFCHRAAAQGDGGSAFAKGVIQHVEGQKLTEKPLIKGALLERVREPFKKASQVMFICNHMIHHQCSSASPEHPHGESRF